MNSGHLRLRLPISNHVTLTSELAILEGTLGSWSVGCIWHYNRVKNEENKNAGCVNSCRAIPTFLEAKYLELVLKGVEVLQGQEAKRWKYSHKLSCNSHFMLGRASLMRTVRRLTRRFVSDSTPRQDLSTCHTTPHVNNTPHHATPRSATRHHTAPHSTKDKMRQHPATTAVTDRNQYDGRMFRVARHKIKMFDHLGHMICMICMIYSHYSSVHDLYDLYDLSGRQGRSIPDV